MDSLISKVLLMGGNAKNMREKLIILQSVMSELVLRKRNLNYLVLSKLGNLGSVIEKKCG